MASSDTQVKFRTSGASMPIWAMEQPKFSTLAHNIQTDVCVVGGGIAGLTTAYLLLNEGKKVVLLERGEVVSGESGRTTAHIQMAYDDRYYQLIEAHGLDRAKQVCQSQYAARDIIEGIVKKEKIDCDYSRVDGYLVLEEGDKFGNVKDSDKSLEKEFKACQEVGALATFVGHTPAKQYNKALLFPECGQFHPVKYLYRLAELIQEKGGSVFTNSMAKEMGKGKVVTYNGHTVEYKYLVVATGTPVNDRVTFHTKQEAYRSYVIGARIPKDAFREKFLLWTTGENYKYVRLEYDQKRREKEDCDYLIIGGCDSKVGDLLETVPERYHFLEDWSKQNFPMIQSIDYHWSGNVYEPFDFLPYAGRDPGMGRSPNEYVITGDSGTGMTNQTASAKLVTDLIMGRSNPWQEAFDPARKPWREAMEWLRGQMDVGLKLKDYITPSDINDEQDLKPRQGAVLKKNLKPTAIYKDEHGKVFYYSAVCTHLKCVVRWNDFEKSFDCPCHGSRFGVHGEVLNGPANQGLTPIEDLMKQPTKEKSQQAVTT